MTKVEMAGEPTGFDAQRQRTQRKLKILRAYLSKHTVARLRRTLVYRGEPVGAFALSCRYRHQQGELSPRLTSELEAIPGWTWDWAPRSQDEATPNVRRLREHVQSHGWEGLDSSTVIDGSRVGAWILDCRAAYRRRALSQNLQAALEGVPGWTWEAKRPLADEFPNVKRLRAFVETHGWDDINVSTVLDGRPIGRWITNLRAEHKRGTLSQNLTGAVERIPGWSWDTHTDYRLRRVLAGIRKAVERQGWSAITRDTVIEGVQVGLWLGTRRTHYRQRRIAPWLAAGLEAIAGWSWKAKPGRYEYRDMRALLAEYVASHGWLDLEWDTTFRGARIGCFLQERLLRHREGRLPGTTRKALESISGWRWDRDVATTADRRMLAELKAHVRTQGWTRIGEWTKFQETRLGRWLRFCRSRRTRNYLPETLRRALERVPGWTWDFRQIG